MSTFRSRKSFRLECSIDAVCNTDKVYVSDTDGVLFTLRDNVVNIHDLVTGKTSFVDTVESDDAESLVITSFVGRGDYLFVSFRDLTLKRFSVGTRGCGHVWKPHDLPVVCMDISGCGKYLITGSNDHTIKVWCVSTLGLISTLRGHIGQISRSIIHTRDEGVEIYSGYNDGQIVVWNLKGRLATLKEHTSCITSLVLSACGSHLVSGSRDKSIKIWDKTSRKCIKSMETMESIASLTMVKYKNRDEYCLVSGGDDATVKYWNCDKAEVEMEFKAANVPILYLKYIERVDLLLCITDDHNIQYYDPFTMTMRSQIIGNNLEIIDLAFVTDDGNYLAVATSSSELKVYNLQNKSCALVEGHTDTILSLCSRSERGVFATGSKDSTARIWKISRLSPFDARCVGLCLGHTGYVSCVSISHRKEDGFVTTVSQDGLMKYWTYSSSGNDQCLYRLISKYTIKAHDKDVNTIDVSPNDMYIATGSQDKTVNIFESETGNSLGVITGHKKAVWSAKFSSDSQSIVTSSADSTIKIWSVRSLMCLKTFESHENIILKAQFIHNGTQVVSSGSEGLLRVWDVKSGRCLCTLDEHEGKTWSLALSSDEHTVATGGVDSKINVWKDNTEEMIAAEHKIKSESVIKENEFQNFILDNDYVGAILMALREKQPFRLLNLFKLILDHNEENRDGSVTGSSLVDNAILSLSPEDLGCIFGFIQNWCVYYKNIRVCSALLKLVLNEYSKEKLLEVPNMPDVVQSILPYMERHYHRLGVYMIEFNVVDYALYNLKPI